MTLAGADEVSRQAFASAAKRFSASGAITGFGDPGAGVKSVVFGRAPKRGPMAVPAAARLRVRDILLESQTLELPLSNILDLVEADRRAGASPCASLGAIGRLGRRALHEPDAGFPHATLVP